MRVLKMAPQDRNCQLVPPFLLLKLMGLILNGGHHLCAQARRCATGGIQVIEQAWSPLNALED